MTAPSANILGYLGPRQNNQTTANISLIITLDYIKSEWFSTAHRCHNPVGLNEKFPFAKFGGLLVEPSQLQTADTNTK